MTVDLPGLKKPKPASQKGWPRGKSRKPEPANEDDMREALQSRQRRFLGPLHGLTYFRAPHLTHDGGFCLDRIFADAGRQDEISTVWGVWQNLCTARRTYKRLVIGQTGEAKCAKITTAPEPLQASELDPPADDRSEEERHRDAIDNWQKWQGYMEHLKPARMGLLFNVMESDNINLWVNGRPTPLGRVFTSALDELADVVSDDKKRTKG